MEDILIGIKLEAVTCCNCGVPFGIPDYLNKRLQADGGHFFCPNGHKQHYSEPTNIRLQSEIDWYRKRMKDDRAELQATKNSLRSTKAAHTRTRNRIKNGVCPCCSRHFEDLQRHMENKHPDYPAVEIVNAT